MRLKSIFTIILLLVSLSGCTVNKIKQDNMKIENEKQEKQKNDFLEERPIVNEDLLSDIKEILILLKQKDLSTLNTKYIHPDFSYYELIKDEKENKINIIKKLTFNENIKNIESFEIKQEEIIFNCSPLDDSGYGWNKEGVFLAPCKDLHLSQIMNDENQININSYKDEDIKKAIFIEKTSYEVIVPYGIIFHITSIDKQWYITVVDKTKTDCSK